MDASRLARRQPPSDASAALQRLTMEWPLRCALRLTLTSLGGFEDDIGCLTGHWWAMRKVRYQAPEPSGRKRRAHAAYEPPHGSWNALARRFHLAAGCFVFATREAFDGVWGFSEQVYAGEEIAFSLRMQRWGRQHGQRFCVLPAPKVQTSGRKADWYSLWQHLGLLALLVIFPFALRFKRLCGFWYRRPGV